jgi:hypothetical protein
VRSRRAADDRSHRCSGADRQEDHDEHLHWRTDAERHLAQPATAGIRRPSDPSSLVIPPLAQQGPVTASNGAQDPRVPRPVVSKARPQENEYPLRHFVSRPRARHPLVADHRLTFLSAAGPTELGSLLNALPDNADIPFDGRTASVVATTRPVAQSTSEFWGEVRRATAHRKTDRPSAPLQGITAVAGGRR